MTEAHDIAKAQAGDRDAAGRVLAAHRGLIVQWCNDLVQPGLELDDMIQEAHLAGLSAIRWFRPRRGFQFSTYLKRCVCNRLATWRQDRRQRPTAQEPEEDGTLELLAELDSHDNFVVMQMVRSLSKRDRTVLDLRFGLSGGGPLGPVTVARRLGISEAHVRQIEVEAKADLRFMAGPGYDPAG
jgi:RNA polymerase sporulation-specific sigma factor